MERRLRGGDRARLDRGFVAAPYGRRPARALSSRRRHLHGALAAGYAAGRRRSSSRDRYLLAAVAGGGAELRARARGRLGTARGAFHRAGPARAVAIEGVLLVGGLAFARFLATGSGQPTAFALWGFFLVQSWFFLVGGIEVRRADGRHPDAFEEAFARATEVIERGTA
jgi:hypothetical protein